MIYDIFIVRDCLIALCVAVNFRINRDLNTIKHMTPYTNSANQYNKLGFLIYFINMM